MELKVGIVIIDGGGTEVAFGDGGFEHFDGEVSKVVDDSNKVPIRVTVNGKHIEHFKSLQGCIGEEDKLQLKEAMLNDLLIPSYSYLHEMLYVVKCCTMPEKSTKMIVVR